MIVQQNKLKWTTRTENTKLLQSKQYYEILFTQKYLLVLLCIKCTKPSTITNLSSVNEISNIVCKKVKQKSSNMNLK